MAEEKGNVSEMTDSDKRLDALCDMIKGISDAVAEGHKRMDARMDAIEERHRSDAAKKDAEGEVKEPGEPKEPVADKRKDEAEDDRKDSEAERQKEGYVEDRKDEDEKERREDAHRRDARKDAGRKDGEEGEEAKRMADSQFLTRAEADSLRAEIASLQRRAPAIISDADRERFASIQEEADPAFQAFGDRAPAPLDGETPMQYKRRLGAKMQGHSSKWKATRLSAIADEAALDTVIGEIYADSLDAARAGALVPRGQLREIKRQEGGHTFIDFVGEPGSWMRDFSAGVVQRG